MGKRGIEEVHYYYPDDYKKCYVKGVWFFGFAEGEASPPRARAELLFCN